MGNTANNVLSNFPIVTQHKYTIFIIANKQFHDTETIIQEREPEKLPNYLPICAQFKTFY